MRKVKYRMGLRTDEDSGKIFFTIEVLTFLDVPILCWLFRSWEILPGHDVYGNFLVCKNDLLRIREHQERVYRFNKQKHYLNEEDYSDNCS